MKKTVQFVLLILVIVALPAFAWKFFERKKSESSIENTKAVPEISSVFLVVTGFGSERSSISKEELLREYCAGRIYITKQTQAAFKKYFHSLEGNKNKECQSPIVLESYKDFSPIAKDKLLITDLDNMTSLYKALTIDSFNFFENPTRYPLQTGDRTGFEKQITKYTMTGVTAITRAAGRTADREGIDFLTKNLKPYFQNSDFVHISNEVSFKDSCEYVAGTTRFCTKEIHFKALTDLHCNIVELTGNHNRDYGDNAYKKTFQWYQDHDIKTFGGGLNPTQANAPLVLSMKDGKKLGLIGFNEACPLGECAKKENEPGANFYTKEKAAEAFRKMREELHVDFIIASVQFTEWDKYEPHATQLRISRDLVDMGADFVYGSQAHQIQQVEFYKGKPIFFGLGNFLFDQIHRVAVRQAFFLNHYFYDGKLVQTIPVYTFMKDNRQQSIATSQERKEMEKAILLDSLLYKEL